MNKDTAEFEDPFVEIVSYRFDNSSILPIYWDTCEHGPSP